jgi:hypothetical protein
MDGTFQARTPEPAMKLYSNKMRLILAAPLLLVTACAPEPTEPADTDLGGVWTANAHLYTLSNFRMEILQEPQGIVSGTWFARGDGGRGGCPPETPCDATGDLIGRNSVSQVEIELIGAGRFRRRRKLRHDHFQPDKSQ